MTLAFIACVEHGPLEPQAVLLCRSIRRYAGRHRDAPIYAFQPRGGPALRPETLELAALDVEHVTTAINTEFAEYAFGNKILVSAWAEEHLPEDVIVFTDTDTVFTGEPAEFDLADGVDAAVRPAHSVTLNSSGPDDPRDAYWRQVHRRLGLQDEPYVVTELGNRVRAYFSAGLIVTRRTAGVMRAWRATFRRLVAARLLPTDSGIRRMDEVSLAASLVPRFARVKILDGRYNYLIYRRERLTSPWREASLSQLVHLHYRDSFQLPGFLRDLAPKLDDADEVFRWLDSMLPLPAEAGLSSVVRRF